MDSDWEYEVEQLSKIPMSQMLRAGTSSGTAHAPAAPATPPESDNDDPVASQNEQHDIVQLPIPAGDVSSLSSTSSYTSSSSSEEDIVEPFPKVARGAGRVRGRGRAVPANQEVDRGRGRGRGRARGGARARRGRREKPVDWA